MHIKKNMKFGIFIDWVYSEYHQKILTGIMDYIKGLPIDLVCYPTGRLDPSDRWERKKNILFDFVDKNNTDGLIVLSDPLQCSVGKNKFSRFLKRYKDFPIVSISEKFDEHYSIVIDNAKGIVELLDHLVIKHHYEKIAFITGPEGSKESNERLQAFLGYFMTYGLHADENLIVEGDFTGVSGRLAVKTLIDTRKVPFDCIVAANDEMAIGAIEELASRGIHVPGDAYVTGYDDIDLSGQAALTTVRQPIYELGRKSAEILYRVLTKKDTPGLISMPTSLVVRRSCGCQLQRLMNVALWKKGMQPPSIPFEENFSDNSAIIVNDIISGFPVEKYIQYKSDLTPWLETLCEELQEANKKSNAQNIMEHGIRSSFNRKLKTWIYHFKMK